MKTERAEDELVGDAAECIYEMLEAQGVTQAEVSRLLGIHRSHINRLLRGDQNMSLKTLAKVASVLGYRVTIQVHKSGA